MTSPAESILKTNLYKNLTSGHDKKYEIFRCALNVLPLCGWVRLLTAQRSIRVLRRVFHVIELQACHRVFAPSRRDQDRERIFVVPRLFALSIGRYHRCGGRGSPQRTLFAQHVH